MSLSKGEIGREGEAACARARARVIRKSKGGCMGERQTTASLYSDPQFLSDAQSFIVFRILSLIFLSFPFFFICLLESRSCSLNWVLFWRLLSSVHFVCVLSFLFVILLRRSFQIIVKSVSNVYDHLHATLCNHRPHTFLIFDWMCYHSFFFLIVELFKNQ